MTTTSNASANVEDIAAAAVGAGFDTKHPGYLFAIKAVSLFLVGFSLYTAMFGVLPDVQQRGVHLASVMGIVYLMAAGHPNRAAWHRPPLLIMGMLAVAASLYQTIFYDQVVARYGTITEPELWIAAFLLVLLFDATRRVIGWSMVVLAIFFLAYAFWGNFLPPDMGHRGYGLTRVFSQVFLGADGVFGTPLGVSATFVILIVIFGALLEATGATGVLMDVAVAMTGRSRGGPAKAAVVGSSLMGMISGTAVANVLTTGTISIPLMKRAGYKGRTAAAIEAVSSTGGQLMPPIMGAAAFLMASITETAYTDIATAAILPALLFYVAVFAMVHLEAVKGRMQPIPEHELPSARAALLRGGHTLAAIPCFVGLLYYGYSVMFASIWAIVVLVVLGLLRRNSRQKLAHVGKIALGTAEAILPVALATACAGVIIAVVTLTGLGLKFSALIEALSGGNLIVALVLTMIASLVLGMGLPTAAAYILVATLAAPALVQLGVSTLAAHFFVFYSAMLSAITPPVALAAFAAAAISRESPLRIAALAVKYGVVAFVVPYLFVLDPRLLGEGPILLVLVAAVTAVIGAVMLAIAVQGYFYYRLSALPRLALFVAALLLIIPGMTTNLVGLTVFAGVWLLLRRRSGRLQADAATGGS